MEIKTAEFVKGITGTNEILNDNRPQVAFIGRSNVGKSSVINSLVNRKDLVKSGSKPGKTRQINFFLINQEIYFVDLPGYGFMKASLKERDKAVKMILWYLFRSGVKFKKVILIIDVKVGLTDFDQEMLGFLNQDQIPVIIIANKSDKLKKNQLKDQIEKIKKSLGERRIIPYSAKTKLGRDDLLDKIW
ncbi:MAG: ribosome biogenesis GTP-binding protein YihA/YsxC [Patescibacteria group bacterium]|nr:ribosome biogenesis GTP-binding protein YihA/YsxC [Patescibacteria group bacterium]MBU2068565.1 ribosome biogenesis GTP-binding protein YihA/YsxC [Patescibacteria group bacterium]